jgi:DMSO reductase family type II enzyme heme b subunit
MQVRRKVRAWRGADPVIEYIARGFGTLTPRMDASVDGISNYSDGRWTVVLRRGLTSSNPTDAAFVAGETTPFILAVWNGEQEEVNGRKAVTYAWIPAKFDGLGSATTKSDVGASLETD